MLVYVFLSSKKILAAKFSTINIGTCSRVCFKTICINIFHLYLRTYFHPLSCFRLLLIQYPIIISVELSQKSIGLHTIDYKQVKKVTYTYESLHTKVVSFTKVKMMNAL